MPALLKVGWQSLILQMQNESLPAAGEAAEITNKPQPGGSSKCSPRSHGYTPAPAACTPRSKASTWVSGLSATQQPALTPAR